MKLMETLELSRKGSITVFLTFIFTIMLSLVTAFIENVRVITSESYVSMAASSAIEMVFGNYNKELYDEYKLFAYGGYDGIGISDFESELTEIVNKNLEYKPEKSLKIYSNLYRLKDISCEMGDFYMLDEDKVFLEQISNYNVTATLDNVKNFVVKNDESNSKKGLFDEVIKYENGEYDTHISNDENNADEKSVDVKNKDAPLEEDIDSDLAGGNPLDAFKNLINNGLLSLVCDVSHVSESKIDIEGYDYSKENSSDDNSSAAKFFKSLLEGEESDGLDQNKLLQEAEAGSNTDKLKYIYYAENVLSSYVDSKYNTVHYGLEYLIAGKGTEKQNLAYIVRRLLIIRTLLNMVYVSTNSLLQSKSLNTATIIAGVTGIPPVITAIQWLILTILAFEEACIDVTALLDGKKVPLIKSPSNFKMQYEEICTVSHSFFKSKSKAYPKADKSNISADISYKQYLMLLELCISKEKLKNRIIDIIQFDLRERFNQTFEFRDCICAAECKINYNIPYSYSYIKKTFSKLASQDAGRYIITSYSYVADIW